MGRYVVNKLLFAIPTLFAVLTLVFVITRIIPGDPAQLILGDQASAEAIAALHERLGLDRPIYVQYFDFLGQILQGDLGQSLASGKPVAEAIGAVLPYTLELTLASLVFGSVIGIPLGVWAAVNRNRIPDYLTRIGSLLGLSFPAFVSAVILLLVFAIQLDLFPVIGDAKFDEPGDHLRSLVLPTVNLGILMAAYITRVTRSSMLEVLGEDFIRTARAKGVARRRIIRRHALQNAVIPVVTVVGLYLGILIGNSVLTEIVFNRPGLGKLIVGALAQRDYPMLQGLMVLYTALIVGTNILTDLAYGLIDPRVKYE